MRINIVGEQYYEMLSHKNNILTRPVASSQSSGVDETCGCRQSLLGLDKPFGVRFLRVRV
jgi:hypothetical protein